jgi:hypothetical protein
MQSWISVAVLLVSIAAPLQSHEVTVAESGVAGLGVMAEISGNGTCEAEQEPRDRTGLYAVSYVRQTCFADGGVLVGADYSSGGWTANRFEESLGNSHFGDPGLRQVSSAQAASIVAELAAGTPNETPAGTKVPEPATLVLVGAGMIATSGLSRIKRQPKVALRVAAASLGVALH